MMIIVVMLMINDDNSKGRGGQWGDFNAAKLTGSRREDGEKALTRGDKRRGQKTGISTAKSSYSQRIN
jgi:hypothetical protein